MQNNGHAGKRITGDRSGKRSFCQFSLLSLAVLLLLAFSGQSAISLKAPQYHMTIGEYCMVIGGKSMQERVIRQGGVIDRDYGDYFTAWFDNGRAQFKATEAIRIRYPSVVSINGYSYNPVSGSPDIPAQVRGRPSERFLIVQFTGPISRRHIEDLLEAGVELKWYLPDYAYVADAKTSAQLSLIRNHPEVKSVTPFFPAYKLDPAFIENGSGTVRVCISTWDAERMPDVIEFVERHGGTVNAISE
ncbi:MAG: hypothetical protein ACYS8W_10080, partial [Planctomycetota bacterium]